MAFGFLGIIVLALLVLAAVVALIVDDGETSLRLLLALTDGLLFLCVLVWLPGGAGAAGQVWTTLGIGFYAAVQLAVMAKRAASRRRR